MDITKQKYLEWQRNYQREYDNKPEVKAKKKEYLQKPEVKERRREQAKKYRAKNPNYKPRVSSNVSLKEYQKTYSRKRYQNDLSFRFMCSLRNRQKQVLKGITSTTDGLGCTSNQLVDHIVSQFTEGMTFDNYGNRKGQWNIDHITPISKHEKTPEGNWDLNSEYNKKLIHYTNLRPMWCDENIKKSNK